MPTGGNFACPNGTGPVVDNELRVLCDAQADGTVTPFLRRYTIDTGVVSTTDTTLDGQTPYAPDGVVTVCGDLMEESPTEPCPDQTTPIATTGLCLADGSPIAVTVERDCSGVVTRTGWLDLTTGAWSAGAPPVGTIACGNSQAFHISGLLCDVDPNTGDVLGLVLVELERGPDGEIVGTRLINPADGSTYTLQGDLTVCPAGVQQPEQDLTVLCDVQPDGTATPFARDFRRDENGIIVGHSDYTLDGQPYNPTGQVGVCQAEDGSPPEACRDCETITLCDSGDQIDTIPGDSTTSGTLPNGIGWSTDTSPSAIGTPEEGWFLLQAFGTPQLFTFDTPVSVEFQLTTDGPPIEVSAGAEPVQVHPNHTWDPVTRRLSSTSGDLADRSVFATTAPTTEIGLLSPATGDAAAFAGAFQVTLDGEQVTFLRRLCYGCDGEPLSVTDTELDGVTDYAPVGQVGVCGPTDAGEVPCRNTSTLLVCDIPGTTETAAVPLGTLGVGPTGGTLPNGVGFTVDRGNAVTGGGQDFYGFASSTTTQTQTWGFDQPADVKVAFGHLQGAAGAGNAECVIVPANLEPETIHPNHTWDPAARRLCGVQGSAAFQDLSTFTSIGKITAFTWQNLPLAAGPGYRGVGLVEVTVATPATQFLRTIVTDCETGAIVSVTDQTLDGEPYTVTGDVGACLPATPQPQPCQDCETITLCDLGDTSPGESPGELESTPFLRTICRSCDGQITTVENSTLDGEPYDVVGEVGLCSPTGEQPCRNTSTLLVCDLPVDGQPAPAVTDTDPTPYTDALNWPGSSPVAGGAAALWSGGTLNIPPDTAPAPDGHPQHTRSLAATVQAARPGCDTGMATVTASIRVERTGPDDGCGGTGHIALLVGTTQVDAEGVVPPSVPVGTVQTLEVSAQVPAADLANGDIALLGRFETYHLAQGSCPGGSNPDGARIGGWTLDQFEITTVFDQAGCAAQVFANVVTDCETGQVESITYTTTNGNPYTPVGEIGECQPLAPTPCPVADTFTRCTCDDINGDGSEIVSYTEVWAFGCEGGPPTLMYQYQDDPGTPYQAVNPVSCSDLATPGEQMVGVKSQRIELQPGETWDAATVPLLQSVTAVAVTGQGQITTDAGTSTLYQGEHATWSVVKEPDLTLQGPLTIEAATGVVTITYTEAVTA